jgi:hypothetical protein
MFEDWIKQKQTATDIDIENDFQIPRNTLKKWRLANQGPKVYFRLNDKILYPRVEFVEWFMQHIKNKKATVVPFGSNRTKENISEK